MVIAKGCRAGEIIIRSIIIARCLGVDLYAVYAVISAFALPFVNLFNANAGITVIKYGTEFKEAGDQKRVFALIKLSYLITTFLYLCFGAVVALAVWRLYPLFFDHQGLNSVVVVFALASGATLFSLLGKTLLAL